MLKKMQREGEGMNLRFVRMWHDNNKTRFCGDDNGILSRRLWDICWERISKRKSHSGIKENTIEFSKKNFRTKKKRISNFRTKKNENINKKNKNRISQQDWSKLKNNLSSMLPFWGKETVKKLVETIRVSLCFGFTIELSLPF
jgi:hypothetical protein